MQAMKPEKSFCKLIANKTSLNALLEVKLRLADYLPQDTEHDKRSLEFLWQEVLWGIWGKASQNGGNKVIDDAKDNLRSLYKQVFA